MTTTEIAVPMDQPTGLAVWAQGAREVHALAEHVAMSALVPAAYRGKPVDVLACWLTGQELGIQPMTALRSIDVIKGTPSLRAHAMRALLLSRGHQVQLIESTPTRCVMRGRRKGEEDWTPPIEWTIERAKQMGLIGKVAEGKVYDPSKDQWVTQPQTMLIARATGEVCRLVAPDVLYGVPYATEEVGDMEPIRAEASVDKPAAMRGADLIAGQPTTPAPAPQATDRTIGVVTAPSGRVVEVVADEQPVPDGWVEPGEQKISGPQLRKLGALMREAGVEDRDARLAWVSEILERTVASSNDLTRSEASRVIDAVQRYIDAEGQSPEQLDPAAGPGEPGNPTEA